MKELALKAYGEFTPVSNIKNAWRKSIDVDGGECVVVVVQTQQ
ncbi:hypothetical protein [Comamonas odontotermitis]|nr:hypothetical protein [Comamonas odontotermitis]